MKVQLHIKNIMPEITVRNLKELILPSIGEEFEILQQNQKMLTAPGDHYGSIMLALDVKIKRTKTNKEEWLNLVAKMIPASDLLRDMFDVQITFKKEIAAYLDAIPAIVQFQIDNKVPKERILDIFPKCYGARINLNNNNGIVNNNLNDNKGNLSNSDGSVDEDAAIILENLKIQGYVTGDRFIGLNLEEARLIVQDLAKFHSVLIAMQVLKPEVFKIKVVPCSVKNGCFDKIPEEVGQAFYNSLVDGAKQIVELEPYLTKIQDLVKFGIDDMVSRPAPNKLFATVVHSDYWLSNTMLLHDSNGKPIKNKMVDLQIMQYNSCLRDLVFFLFTSVINSVLDAHFDDLIKVYYTTFMDYLQDFKIDHSPYTWDAFLQELNDVGPKEFYHVGFMLKPIFTEKGKVESFENFQSSDWCKDGLLGDAHKRKLRDLVFSYEKRGWI